eukprot:CAMPEP_0170373102 /NCGR_PEP_ID=MMETSP0117_2-20130122/9898_1 /TAXON_ID=400756 /ORGANISM="Durinskia baltica, Strain CSIRO CS-38" /LENGTH=241 /DNA_ID=CAMNT_0010627987 /DNA_START=27 /DNA_END=749 /DNA_ORIENTATION=-
MFEKEGFNEMYKIVCSMMSRPESLAFREPVDWKGLGLVDYLSIVKQPMDLGTVKSKIEAEKYNSIEDIAFDVRLVWRNCMLYNRDGSEFYHLADKFARGFEEAYTALRRLEDSKADLERIPSVDEKLQLSYDIFKITNTDMARVLTMIEASCPSALSKKISTDEVLVNFDALTPRCFHEVNSFVLACFLNLSGNKKNKKRKVDASLGTGGGDSAAQSSNKELEGGVGSAAAEEKNGVDEAE